MGNIRWKSREKRMKSGEEIEESVVDKEEEKVGHKKDGQDHGKNHNVKMHENVYIEVLGLV
jgi:hypothetical protein